MSTAKPAAEPQGRTHEKDIEKAAMENELTCAKVDALYTDAHNTQLCDAPAKLVAEPQEKDGPVD